MAEQNSAKPISDKVSLRDRREKELKRVSEVFSKDLKLNDFEKTLLREKWLDPRASDLDLAKKYGMSKSGIHHYTMKQKFKDASAQLHGNLFLQIQMLQFKAIKNLGKFLDFEDDDPNQTKLIVKYKASRDLLHAPLTAPASLPASRRELPEFTDPDSL